MSKLNELAVAFCRAYRKSQDCHAGVRWETLAYPEGDGPYGKKVSRLRARAQRAWEAWLKAEDALPKKGGAS